MKKYALLRRYFYLHFPTVKNPLKKSVRALIAFPYGSMIKVRIPLNNNFFRSKTPANLCGNKYFFSQPAKLFLHEK
jgi:hypothetical protein